MYVCMYVCIDFFSSVYVYMHACMYVCMYVWPFVSVSVCMYVGTNAISSVNPLQFNEIQLVTCRADGGTFTLTFRGNPNPMYVYMYVCMYV